MDRRVDPDDRPLSLPGPVQGVGQRPGPPAADGRIVVAGRDVLGPQGDQAGRARGEVAEETVDPAGHPALQYGRPAGSPAGQYGW
jgi:hypothetical protein